jgi:hypothetical protein
MTHCVLFCDGIDLTMGTLESRFTDASSMPGEKRICEKKIQF